MQAFMVDALVQEQQLRQEVAGLADDDILALCYAFKGPVSRLRLYVDVLRGRGGQRAQFASCLICFDLARRGDPSFQREFIYLADTVRELAHNRELVRALVGTDPYLTLVWEMCQAALEEMDPLGAEPLSLAPGASAQPVAELELLADADFQDFGVATDDITLWRRFDDAVEGFLGGMVGVPIYERGCGFRLQSNRDVERIETFLTRLDSLRDLVPPARGFRALVLLFYGTQMRSRGLFGQLNMRKQELLREGLREFMKSGADVWEIVGVMGPLHASERAWESVCEVLLDYAGWLLRAPPEAREAGVDPLEYYEPVARLGRR